MGWEAGEETSMHRTLDPRSRDLGLFVLFAPSIDKDQRLPELKSLKTICFCSMTHPTPSLTYE